MKKSKKSLTQDLSFTIDMNELSLNRRKFDTAEIGRGVGVQKSKKGKGSYTRKNVKFADSSCGYFFILSCIKMKTYEYAIKEKENIAKCV